MRAARLRTAAARLGFAGLTLIAVARAQDMPRVSVTRRLAVAGILLDRGNADLLGLSRVKFQGLIASELSSVGYRLVEAEDSPARRAAGLPPLTLVGTAKEEICDDQTPMQCRVAIRWELQDPTGVVVYRTTTRAVGQASTIDKQRRGLVVDALRSLIARRRFALQLIDPDAATKPIKSGPLGFQRCRRPALALPQAERSAAASLVFVESGSNLQQGAIVSPDGLVLTGASAIERDAPLRVRFTAEQTLPATIVALDHSADVALLHAAAHTEMSCLRLRETPLPAGSAAYGVSSEPGEDHAISLNGSVVKRALDDNGVPLLQVDARIARVEGAPLLDEQGQLAAVVSARYSNKSVAGAAQAVEVGGALRALAIVPAAITDPRLARDQEGRSPTASYVRDPDDPPFILGRRYTYGTSPVAHKLRTAGAVTFGVGAFGVAATWFAFKGNRNLSPSAHGRLVVINDLSWALIGLGAVGFGASYVVPEGHDVVAAQTAADGHYFVGLGPGGVIAGANL